MPDLHQANAPGDAPGPDAIPAASTPEDVANAYRAVLGRNPETESVITHNLRRRPTEILRALLRSAEFARKLADIAAGRMTSHGLLPAEAREAAWHWARERGLLAEGMAPGPAPSPAVLLGALLAAPGLAAEAEALPEALRPAVQLLRERPGETALHRLSQPAGAEDARHLHALLHGAAAEPWAPPPGAAGPGLHHLLRAAIAETRFRAGVLHPLLRDGTPPVFGLASTELEAAAAWLAGRLGAPVPAGPALFAGAALAALLRLPAVAALVETLWPEEAAALEAALPGLESGAQHLAALRSAGEDATLAYLAVLGRAPESAAVRLAHEGARLGQLLATLLASGEFRAHVLGRLIAEEPVPHHALGAEQRRMVGAWLAARLGLHPPPRAPVPLHAMSLLARLLALPAVDAELARLHGLLWTEAAGALHRWVAEGAARPIGGIDYVTGDWIAGWAMDPTAPPGTPLEIEIHCNGERVALGRADRPRPHAPEGGEGGAGDCGFRIPWRGRSHLRGGAEGYRFQIVAARSGQAAGPPLRLDSVFVEPRTTLQMIAAELAQTRATLRRLEAMLPQLESFTAFAPGDHDAFRRQHRLLPPPSAAAEAAPVAFRIIIPGDGVSVRGLRRVIGSLERQAGPVRWEALLLVTDTAQAALAGTAAAREPRLAWRAVDPGPAAMLAAERAAALGAPEDRLVLLLPPAALLAEGALAWFAHWARRFPDSPAACADEDHIEEVFRDEDRHADPVFRAAPDPWQIAQANPCGALLCARAAPLRAALAAAAGCTDRATQRWVAWAALAQAGPVAHIPRLLASLQADQRTAPDAESAPPIAALRPLLRHPWLLEPDWGAAAGEPARITAIVPTRNGGPLLREGLAALRDRAADPGRLEVLVVDNGSDAPETLEILAGLEAAGMARVLRIAEPFNWSRLNNLAVRATAPEGLLLFLNDDTRMLTGGWDRRLRRLLAEPEVGAVGALLVYEDLTIQHAGVLFGVEGLAAHEGVGATMQEGGPGGRWQRLRAAGAVTGAFLGCRREVFDRVGPFDEQALGITFNDVDFCLRLRAAGLSVLYAPQIALVHYESKSRGIDDLDAAKAERAAFERRQLVARWGEAVLLDPGFNPHWSRWARPFAAIREPSAAEIARHLAASAAPNPWNPLAVRVEEAAG